MLMTAMEILRSEFGCEPGSFMLTARIERRWDREGFQRLQRAMLAVCREVAGGEPIERWIAEGFWFVERSCARTAPTPRFLGQNHLSTTMRPCNVLSTSLAGSSTAIARMCRATDGLIFKSPSLR
jgi:hypothetical protein